MIPLVAFVIATLAGFWAGYRLGLSTCRHEWTLVFSPTRVRLECPRCGTSTPGWDLNLESPRARVQ